MNNIRGIKSKKLSLQKIINEENPAIVGIVETHLQEGEPFELDELEGYCKPVRNDRKEQEGGGVMLLYKKELKNIVTIVGEEKKDFEAIWMKINNGRIDVKVGVIYMPQETETTVVKMKEIYKKIEAEIQESIEKDERLMIMGDFNCKIGIDESSNNSEISKGGKFLLQMVRRNDMLVLNMNEKCKGKWTRRQGSEQSAIDFILMRHGDERYLESMVIDKDKTAMTPFWKNDTEIIPKNVYTDHGMIKIVLNWKMKLEEEQTRKYMGKKEQSQFLVELEKENISKIIDTNNLQTSYSKWHNKVINIANRNMRKPKKKKEWKAARLLRKARKNIKSQIRKEKNKKERRILLQRLKLIGEYIDNELKQKRTVKVNKIVEEIKKGGGVDSEVFWKVRNKIIGKKKEGRYAVEDKDGILRKTPEEIKTVYKEHFDNLLNKNSTEQQDDEEVTKIVNAMIDGAVTCVK
jgi:exonuclease III